MIDLSTLSNILETQKLTDEQSEELQKVIYGLDDGSIIELANMPCVGDTAYVYFKAVDGYSRLLTVKYLGALRIYTSHVSKTEPKVEPVLHFVFVDAASEAAKKEMFELTPDEWDESYMFPYHQINKSFFFNREKAIKVYHNLCCLNARHISEAEICVGLYEPYVDKKVFHTKRNHIIFNGSPEDTLGNSLWKSLFKCGFATVSISNEDGYSCVYSLTPLGLEWLSLFTGVTIKLKE